MAEDTEPPDSSPSPPPSLPPHCRSCRGLLYFSSSRDAKALNPLCVGFSRPEDRVKNYTAGKSEQDATKEGKALLDFKYACLGYSLHRENQATTSGVQLDKHAELPICMGIEILAERRATQGASPTRQEHVHQKEDHKNIEATPVLPRPPTSVRPPNIIGSFTPEEFGSRFIRSAGLVAAAVGKNLSRVGSSIKTMVDDFLSPDRRRPK